MREMTSEDLAQFRAAVRLRERCVDAAVAHHERAGLPPSQSYARATYDAIADLIRADERARCASAERVSSGAASATGMTQPGSAVSLKVPDATGDS